MCNRPIASVAYETAVSNPNVATVPSKSLSIVFWDTDHRDAKLRDLVGDPHRSVAADRDQRVDAVFFETIDQPWRYVFSGDRAVGLLDVVGERIAAIGRAQNRAAGVRDASYDFWIKLKRTAVGKIFGMQQAIETAADPQNLPATFRRRERHRTNDCIEPRSVSAAGRDCNSFDFAHRLVFLCLDFQFQYRDRNRRLVKERAAHVKKR